MASTDIEKLRTALARRTTAMKDIIDGGDNSDLTTVLRTLEVTNDLQQDIMHLASTIMERNEKEFEDELDRYETGRRSGRGDFRGDERGRGRGWDVNDDRGRGGRYNRR